MRTWWLGLKSCVGYFTVFPVRFANDDNLSNPRVLGAMLFWLPWVGLGLAGVTLGVYALLMPTGWLGALIAALAYPMLYGFIHTEALSDVADAIYARHGGKDAYEVIKEPHVGAMGVLWMTSLLTLKTAALAYVLYHHLWWLFAAVVLTSRLGVALLFATQRFRSAFIEQIQRGLRRKHLILSFFSAVLVLAFTAPFGALGLFAAGILLAYAVAKGLGRALGFLNGDVMGATLEIVETLLLLTGARLWL